VWGQPGESTAESGRALLSFAADAGALDGGATRTLDAGNFAPFVAANRLDLEIADLLRELDGYPQGSWAQQVAHFAHHELQVGNLHAIVSAANVGKVKALIPAARHAEADTEAAKVGNGVTVYNIGGAGAHAFFRYALALDGAGWPDNGTAGAGGYLADIKASGKYNEQIALWLQKIGGEKTLFHDDAGKNAAVRQFFKDVYDAVKPAFATPTVAADGGV
jgi:hypothetical protein